MRILVTGGAGRLGRSVVARLVEGGDEVYSLDASAHSAPGAVTLSVDLLDAEAARAAMCEVRPDTIVHLAAISVPFSAPESTIFRVNTQLAFSVAAGAVEAGASRVLVASSPTVLGYGAPAGWLPRYLPLDEAHPVAPWNAYALSKCVVEDIAAMFARQRTDVVFDSFRPCFVISPEEWQGAPTQQGHTVADRLNDPALAAVSLFNYVDARDAADFVRTWAHHSDLVNSGSVYFVGASDALATRPLAELIPKHLEQYAFAAGALTGTTPAFSSRLAFDHLGWRPKRSWRTELSADIYPTSTGGILLHD